MSAQASNENPLDHRSSGLTSPAEAPGSNNGLCAACGQPLTRRGPIVGCLRCSVELALSEEIIEGRVSGELSVSDDRETDKSSGADPIRYGHFEVALGKDGFPVELGAGAMATTYRAIDTVLHSAVALKVINQNVADHPLARARFLREARAAAKLHHPNVANVFHYGEQDGQCYYVMELIEGQTLAERINSKGALTPMEALQVGVQVARALAAAEACGLVHRDLKPANLMLTTSQTEEGDGVMGTHDKGEALYVKVIDWGLAKAVTSEDRLDADQTGDGFVGTPAFASPEQFAPAPGRRIDTRSDIYSLGVTLWYVLCGRAPFVGDTLETIHSRQQNLPMEQLVAANVPESLIEVLEVMLAFDPSARPQSARELLDLLKGCRDRYINTSAMSGRRGRWRRPASRKDVDESKATGVPVTDRVLISEKLYGRDRENKALIDAFDQVVATGVPMLVLVSGYSGIGKSAVVNELRKVLVPPRGLFASGKFDQFKRDVPYATLAQAFDGLIRPLLNKSEADLRAWRDAFCEALGPNGILMVDLVPVLRSIIGEQPPVPDLPPQDAQRRFQLVVRRFIGVFARPEHPLALFLDDLQWLDSATLDLLEDLLASDFADNPGLPSTEGKLRRNSQPDVHHLMLIGAYRDNEVDFAHPLLPKVEAIRRSGAIVREIILSPLAHEDLGQLIADSIHCERELVASLAQLVHEKTAGNPFFAIQFIYALAEEALFAFDYGAGRWSWDLQRINAKGYTDNVVDLMLRKLSRLPGESQKILQALACLGNSAEISTLSIVHGARVEEIEADLSLAVRLGLVVRLEGSYKFVHDRVREAAYSQIPEPSLSATHLRIGRRLLANVAPEKREEAVFEIVNQLNRATALITSRHEREQLAELNLIGAKRARASTAYAAALGYSVVGCGLLAEGSWEQRYSLTFALEFLRAECEFLVGDFAAAEERLAMLSMRILELVDRAAITRLRAELYTALNQTDRAVEACLEYLRHVGIEWSPHPSKDDVEREYTKLWRHLGARPIEQLVDLPPIRDAGCRATLNVLSALAWPAWHSDENLHDLVGTHMANLSLEHGNCDGSCHAYALLGTILGSNLGQYRDGFRFGKLAVDLIDQSGNRFEAHVCSAFGHHITPWARHLRDGRLWNQRAFNVAKQRGDFTNAAFSSSNMIANLLAGGEPLEEVQRQAEDGLEFTRKIRFDLVSDYIVSVLRLVRTLRGSTPKFGSFDDSEFDESRFERHLEEDPRLALAACRYWIRKLEARFYADDYTSAILAAAEAHRFHRRQSFFEVAEYPFYSALAHAALDDSLSGEERAWHFEQVTIHHQQLELWKKNCPENFGSWAALVAGEIARIERRDLEAMHLYESAIQSAQVNGFIQNEAIAHEVAARFYAARGFETIAQTYIKNARGCYLRWGATGKVRKIDQDYPMPGEERTSSSKGSIETDMARQG
jgi:predicted ATPase/tRNA A-37 threonylcarbamoyl transferase component Bud32